MDKKREGLLTLRHWIFLTEHRSSRCNIIYIRTIFIWSRFYGRYQPVKSLTLNQLTNDPTNQGTIQRTNESTNRTKWKKLNWRIKKTCGRRNLKRNKEKKRKKIIFKSFIFFLGFEHLHANRVKNESNKR